MNLNKMQFIVQPGNFKPKQAILETNTRNIDAKKPIYVYPFPSKPPKTLPNKWFMKEIKWLQRAMYSDFRRNGSFHEAIGSILVMAQFFAVMPVIGVKGESATKLCFKWKSIRTLYSAIVFAGLVIYTGLTIWIALRKKNMEFDLIVSVIFYASAVCGVFLFGTLAKEWPSLMQNWECVEFKLPIFRNQNERNMLGRKIKIVTIVIMVASFVEHILSVISTLYRMSQYLRPEKLADEFLRAQASELFDFTPYAAWKVFFGKFLNLVATFVWNYMDLFVIIVSLGLSTRFKQINEDLNRVRGEGMSEGYWALRRTQYQHLSALCFDIDSAISKITMISFSNNLFFICVQLLRSLRPMPSIVHAVYFWFSFIFLITRTLAVSLYASSIHDESKKPAKALRAVPSNSWCLEVRRFLEEVVHDRVALSGMRFFFLTRKLILSVAGTIVTYELVLIQFYKNDHDDNQA